MKLLTVSLSLFVLCLSGCNKDEDTATELAMGVGSRVFAEYPSDGYWYSATVSKETGGMLQVLYDDGEAVEVASSKVMSMQLPAGMCVIVRYQGGEDYYAARVVKQQGEKILVKYDDGEQEVTSPGFIVLKMQTDTKGRKTATCFSSGGGTGSTTGTTQTTQGY